MFRNVSNVMRCCIERINENRKCSWINPPNGWNSFLILDHFLTAKLEKEICQEADRVVDTCLYESVPCRVTEAGMRLSAISF